MRPRVPPRQRLRLVVHGAVQGVGFRPFVYRLATRLELSGRVSNTGQGVFIEVEGPRERLEQFRLELQRDKPAVAAIHSLEASFLDAAGYGEFRIQHSDSGGRKTALILPDIATCEACRREISTAGNHHYLYPFTNCTHCGPRYTIIEALPYDRPNTTMKGFVQCSHCQAEYEDPLDRRFHAQPNACPHCGPHLELWDYEGRVQALYHEALLATAAALEQGAIVALKGLGGFHLLADARSQESVARLRQGKNREEKPFALMYPSLERIAADCQVSALEAQLLESPAAPIVLLGRRRQRDALAPNIAPGNPYLGIVLPYTPLHHLLMGELGFPIVATSGNLSDEPICIDQGEALERLGGIADLFLVHDRPIQRHADDSIARLVKGRELLLRRARGYAPLPIHLAAAAPPVMAVGAHLKNTVALAVGPQVFISQHIGDLETEAALAAFRQVGADLQRLYEVQPEMLACDLHPDYLSTRHARHSGLPLVEVQHHYAHILSCMAENHLEAPVLGVSWDGTGYGLDGTIWGGEFLRIDQRGFARVAHLRTFRLPGGDQALKQPRRTALGLLWEIFGEALFDLKGLAPLNAFSARERTLVRRMLQRDLNAPLTSSAGRLFDAVAAMAGLRQYSRFEGQAAMALEFAIDREVEESYEFALAPSADSAAKIVDWEPVVKSLLEDVRCGVSGGAIAAKFHHALVQAIVAVAREVGVERVALSGGCFQNKYLTERAIDRLEERGFRPYWHQRIPPNDGGIALGQIAGAQRVRQ